VETDDGHRNPNQSDTMLGIDKLYSTVVKDHNIKYMYRCQFIGNPLTNRGTTIYN
jgi:hypothetical protein